jgi:two-component system sensor histidine kinase UhpB
MIKNKDNCKIAIIEDNRGDFILIRDYLQEQFQHPLISDFRSFKEVKKILAGEKGDFDVILLDLALPDNSGEKLITDIIAIAKGVPVIILTGYGDIEFSIKSLSLGVADYLLKDDINASSLYKSIIYCLERKRSLIQLQQSEIRYSNLFNSTPQPMWVYDPQTLFFVQVNKAAVEKYGYSEEEFLNLTLSDIRAQGEIPKLEKALKNLSDIENESFYAGNFRHLTKAKETIVVEIYNRPVILNNKKYRLSIAIDVTEKILLEQKLLQQKIAEQKKTTIAVVNAQEKERSEIGIELHDNVNQLLAASKLYLNQCFHQPHDYKDYLLKTQEYISQAMDELRKLSHALVGPDKNEKVGLIDSLEKLIKDIAFLKKIKISLRCTFCLEENIDKQIEDGVKLSIYRIIQEQVSNILKHANATEVDIEIKENRGLQIIIRDNGKGFDLFAKKDGIGLTNIKNRAEIYNGKVEIITSPGMGCTMNIYFKSGAAATIPS